MTTKNTENFIRLGDVFYSFSVWVDKEHKIVIEEYFRPSSKALLQEIMNPIRRFRTYDLSFKKRTISGKIKYSFDGEVGILFRTYKVSEV